MTCANRPGWTRSSSRYERLPDCGLGELDRPQEPEPAHVAHDVVALDERKRQLEQTLSEARGSRDEVLLVELVQRREPGGHRELVRRERRAVRERVLERVEHGFVHGLRHQQRADRHVAAGERLRDGHEIGLEPPVLEREELSRAPEARLHLVDAEERAVATAERLRAFEVARRRQVHALALHRLDQEQRDVLGPQLALERVEVAERHLRESRAAAARTAP